MEAYSKIPICRMFATLLLIAGLLAFLAAPGICAENYTSSTYDYPDTFKDVVKDTNELTGMDVVSFHGREVVFYTMASTGNNQSDSYTRRLRFFTPGFLADSSSYEDYHGYIEFGNSIGSGLRIKTVVYNNMIYLFYTASNSMVWDKSKIYCRTVTLDTGTDGKGWKLVFSGEQSFDSGLTYAELRMAKVMNGKLYVIYSDRFLRSPELLYGNNWYYISSADGQTFDAGTSFYTGNVAVWGWWASGTVFTVPDGAGGWTERMMIAYVTGGNSIYYFFFDGTNTYGQDTVTPGLSQLYSVRLITGTADGYPNTTKEAIQLFFTTPSTTSGSPSTQWAYMYHGEYIPAGNGDTGSWSSTWGHLWKSNAEGVHCEDSYLTDPNWTVVPHVTNSGSDAQTNLRVWYYRGSIHTSDPTGGWDTIEFRRSSYKSDLLQAQSRRTIDVVPDLRAAVIVGVIEGPPPFPVNGGLPTGDGVNVSKVKLTEEHGATFTTSYTIGAGVAVSYGAQFGPFGVKAEMSTGLSYAKENSDTRTVTMTTDFSSYNYTIPGGIGWVLMLKPQLLIDPFVVKSYSGADLMYDQSAMNLQMNIISYGPNTTLQSLSYWLDGPEKPFGSDTSTAFLKGMKTRPLSVDVKGWTSEVYCGANGVCNDSTYTAYQAPEGGNPLLPVHSTQGSGTDTSYSEETTSTQSTGTNMSFSVSASALGFSGSTNVNYSMNVKTSTVMTKTLEFLYAIPSCSLDPTVCCISYMDVQPYLLLPKSDATGYDAPWISDDIRFYHKVKPWALSYTAYPSNPCTTGLMAGATRLGVTEASGTLSIDKDQLHHDRVTANIVLGGLPADFVLDKDSLLNLGLGSNLLDTNRDLVISRTYQGKSLVVDVTDAAGSPGHLKIRLTYDSAKSELDILLDGDHLNLSNLRAYPFLTGSSNTAPFNFYFAGKYYAAGDFDLHCTSNDLHATCDFQLQ